MSKSLVVTLLQGTHSTIRHTAKHRPIQNENQPIWDNYSAREENQNRRPLGAMGGRQYMSDVTLQKSSNLQQNMPGGAVYLSGTRPKRHSRGSYHEAQIPSTVHEVPTQHTEGRGALHYPPNDDLRSSTLPRHFQNPSSNRNARSAVELPLSSDLRAMQTGSGRGQTTLREQEQALQIGGSLQRINHGYPVVNRSPPKKQHLTISAQNIASSHDFDLPVGVVPPPPVLAGKTPPTSPSHVTMSQGDQGSPRLPQIPETQNHPKKLSAPGDPVPYAVVHGVGMDPGQRVSPSPNPLPSTFAPAKSQSGSAECVPPEQYDFLKPKTTKTSSTHPPASQVPPPEQSPKPQNPKTPKINIKNEK